MKFREHSRRLKNLGIGLLSAAAVLWVWCGVLLTTSYRIGDALSGNRLTCEPRLTARDGTANNGSPEDRCADERDWPEALAVLGLSVPLSAAGAGLLAHGGLGLRLSEHGAVLLGLRVHAARTSQAVAERAAAEKEETGTDEAGEDEAVKDEGRGNST
ncbi:hypothetical protein ACLGIH_32355 [Streptomyces sp. HMX87]|uniref:hypothetical protein n=1 Tax=Streptomyces sp. HMX87 TaxID=3390849 RepID=UPI003A86DBCE